MNNKFVKTRFIASFYFTQKKTNLSVRFNIFQISNVGCKPMDFVARHLHEFQSEGEDP